MTSKVRVLLPPPAFAREASEGCRAEAHLGEGGLCTRATARQAAPKPTWAKAGCVRELRLGKPRRSPLGRRRAVYASYGSASHAEALWAKAGVVAASYGLASHAAIINGKDSRKPDAA